MQAAQTEQIVQSAPQNAQTEETAQTAGSQYSVGTVGREAGQSGVDAGGLKNPVFQKFASVIYKNHGTEIVVANLMEDVYKRQVLNSRSGCPGPTQARIASAGLFLLPSPPEAPL